jgi:hypothetical protein
MPRRWALAPPISPGFGRAEPQAPYGPQPIDSIFGPYMAVRLLMTIEDTSPFKGNRVKPVKGQRETLGVVACDEKGSDRCSSPSSDGRESPFRGAAGECPAPIRGEGRRARPRGFPFKVRLTMVG